MPSHLLVVAAMGSLLPSLTAADSAASREAAALGVTGGIRTDRLSRKELKAWDRVVEIVMAEDGDGRPLHPTLRGLWEEVDSSGHAVYVELVRDEKSYTAGRFEITAVDPEGISHEGRLLLNLRALDRVSTAPAAARDDGFIPFEGLDETERHAELLGHELVHAASHLADPEQARLAHRLHREKVALMRRVLDARSADAREELLDQAREYDRRGRALEAPAEAAEVEIWSELHASRELR